MAVDRSDKYLRLAQLAKRSSFSPSQLRKLLTAGKLHGVKVGNVWLSTLSLVKLCEHSKSSNPQNGNGFFPAASKHGMTGHRKARSK
jgi:hypothetical protein